MKTIRSSMERSVNVGPLAPIDSSAGNLIPNNFGSKYFSIKSVFLAAFGSRRRQSFEQPSSTPAEIDMCAYRLFCRKFKSGQFFFPESFFNIIGIFLSETRPRTSTYYTLARTPYLLTLLGQGCQLLKLGVKIAIRTRVRTS